MRAKAVLLGGLVAVALAPIVASAGWAAVWAADPTPAPAPQTTPSISPPSQQQIEDARNALDRLRHHSGPGGSATPTAGPTEEISEVSGPVAGPVAGRGRPSLTSRISDQAWWTIASGVLVLAVASEATRLRVRRGKHRMRK